MRVRETFPDAVLTAADEVVLVDITPEALIRRLRDGQVYRAERVPAALKSFFRIENLQALREVALRQVAEEVEAKRPPQLRAQERVERRPRRRRAPARPGHAGPSSQRVVRRAWRSAQRLHAELDMLSCSRRRREPPARRAPSSRRCAGSAPLLGASSSSRRATTSRRRRRVARERGTTYVLLGAPSPRRGPARLASRAHGRLLRLLPGVDVRIVADRAGRER